MGEEPPEPFAFRHYSGTFTVRIPPNEHCRLTIQAAREGISPVGLECEAQTTGISHLPA